MRTVAAILANPRYTGRQVWNRQFTDHREQGDKRSSRGPVRMWNPRSDWVISNEPTHAALVSDADFLAVQQVTALAMPDDGRVHRYQLTGLLMCELCGRRMEGHWVNRRAGYRCRHGHTSARPADADGPRWVYWSQACIVEEIFAAGGAELEACAEAGQVATHLRARDLLIVCGPDSVTLDDPVMDDAEAECQTADAQS